MKLFNDEYVNQGRQNELDWARGFAVFFMILVHVKIVLPPYPFFDLYAKVIEFCGSPLAAPMFMMLLGAGIVFSKNNNPKKLAIRGLKLLSANYVLNFIAFGLAYLVVFIQTGDIENIELMISYTIGVDILAFAGLTFLFFALKEKLGLKLRYLILITLVVSSLNYILSMALNNAYLRALPGLFIRVEENSYFPFFSWIGYPVMGYIFGNLLKRCYDKNIFYKYLFAFSVLITTAISLGSIKYNFDLWGMHFGPHEYYYQDFIKYILVGGICFSWISILFFLSRKKALQIVEKQLSRWSQNTTVMYFIHIIIIGWLSILNPIDFPVSAIVNFTTGIVLVIISDIMAVIYKRTFKKL
jgi:uncharacterized membrane protein